MSSRAATHQPVLLENKKLFEVVVLNSLSKCLCQLLKIKFSPECLQNSTE